MRVLPFLMVLVAACSAEAPPSEASVTGRVTRTDGHPDSPWVGAEDRQLTDDVGLCVVTYEVEAVAQEPTCDGCSLSLHVTTSTEHVVVDDCGDGLADGPPVARNLAFRPSGDGRRGDILVADEPEGPWTEWSVGRLDPGELRWSHTARPDRDAGIDEDDLRPLHGPPVSK